MPALRALVLPLALALALATCTRARIQEAPTEVAGAVDNLMSIQGRYCTEPPEETVFPVKLLFILDQSTSLQCTDPQNQRFKALTTVVEALLPQPNVSFGFVGFASWTKQQTFTRDADEIAPFLDPASGEGPATDYQGALASARKLLEEDMIAAGPAETVRSRYVVVMVSDGQPEPRCNAGCEDSISNCADGFDNDADGLADAADPDCADIEDASLHPDSLYPLCNWTADIDPATYTDFTGNCPAYNQPEQILQRVNQLMDLAFVYAAGDITVNSVLIFSPAEVVEEQCPGAAENFGYSHDNAEVVLQAIASAGGGTFRDVNVATEGDDFLTFDYESLFNEQWLTELVVTNANARWVDGVSLDTDMDGLPDALEALIGSLPTADDSDYPEGDGYSDLFEHRLAAAGFDPTDPTLPAIGCLDATDLDGDGLLGCEEGVLGTDDRGPDTDGDGLIDWLEVAVGTDPLIDDALWDLDFDGVVNRDEIRGGTDPLVADSDTYLVDRILYTVDDLGSMDVPDPETFQLESRHCYDFTVDGVQLVTPLTPADRGRNRLMVHTLEKPFQLGDVPARGHVACVEVFYEEGESKEPASGLVDLTQQFWVDQAEALRKQLLAVRQCVEPPPEADPDADPEAGDPEAEDPEAEPEPPPTLAEQLAGFKRGQIVEVIEACMPKKVEVDGLLLPRDDLVELLKRYLKTNLNPLFPEVAAHVFVALEVFDPDDHCARPYELARLERFLELDRRALCRERVSSPV